MDDQGRGLYEKGSIDVTDDGEGRKSTDEVRTRVFRKELM